jgi:hypothetical protein
MLSSLILAVSIWGTEPEIVFGVDRLPPAKSAVSSDDSLTVRTNNQAKSQQNDRVFAEPFVVRAQTVTDNLQDQFSDSQLGSIWDDPACKRLIDEINPFVQIDFPVLNGYFDPYGWQMLTGSNGPQGYRLGWSTYNEFTLLPAAPVFGTTGNMKIVEWNSNAKYSGLIRPGVLFDGTFWFSARWWDGPGGIALPGQVDLFSADLLLGLFDEGPWSAQIAFHPQIVETYEARLDRNAFNFDGRAIVTYTASREWKFVGGVAIWDRVDTMIVPHVGAIWTPNNRWEIRALFPKSRVSYFMGNWKNADFWVYGQYEYTAEAWQTVISDPKYSDRMQIVDQRLSMGLRWDSGRYSFFTEGGYVFDRQAKFAGATPNFNIGDTAMLTFGVRY